MARKCPVIEPEELERAIICLGSSISWGDTPQGYAFWMHIQDDLQRMLDDHYRHMDENGECYPGKPGVDIMAITRAHVGGK